MPTMSEPRTDYPVPIAGASYEALSAMSVLNTYPEPLPGDPGRYLAECDATAKHAYEHIRAAYECVAKAQQQMETLLRECEYVLDVYHGRELPLHMITEDSQGLAVEWIIDQMADLRRQYRAQRKQRQG